MLNRHARSEDSHAAPIRISVATPAEREEIYRLKYEVYAEELAQYPRGEKGSLSDSLDEFNVYIVASRLGQVLGFVSVTPPGHGAFSVDKYMSRDAIPFALDDTVYEVRVLTVRRGLRSGRVAPLLMYAALRWIQSRRGLTVLAIGRREVLDLYLSVGMEPLDRRIRAGAVEYQLLRGDVGGLAHRARSSHQELLARLARGVDWQLGIPFGDEEACFHGGAFFEAVGPRFDHLEQRHGIVNADVLDAWFPPSPKVVEALRADLPWLLQTSPPTHSEGMAEAIAEARGVSPPNIIAGAGSSDLIYLAFTSWLNASSRVLILDPMYGEYAFVLERLIRCRVDRFALHAEAGYRVDAAGWLHQASRGYDLVVIVNPNSPTGQLVPGTTLRAMVEALPDGTRCWIDETYVEYAGAEHSLETAAAKRRGLVICKSMSKVYALSGVRAAYLCASEEEIRSLRRLQPPWAVSLPAQVAAVKALEDPGYYSRRYRQTDELRTELREWLRRLDGVEVLDGVANFLLCRFPGDGPTADDIVRRCRRDGVFLRDAGAMGTAMGRHAIRVAVKRPEQNRAIVGSLAAALGLECPALPEARAATSRRGATTGREPGGREFYP